MTETVTQAEIVENDEFVLSFYAAPGYYKGPEAAPEFLREAHAEFGEDRAYKELLKMLSPGVIQAVAMTYEAVADLFEVFHRIAFELRRLRRAINKAEEKS